MKLLLPALVLSLLIITSCNPGDPPIFEKTTAQKLLGKWKIQRIDIDYYDPIPVLDDSIRHIGLPGDSLVFTPTILYNYEDGDLVPEDLDYTIVNDSTLIIDGELTMIRELTATRLHLFSDEIDQVNNERQVFSAILIR
jgi:hypothetical protein